MELADNYTHTAGDRSPWIVTDYAIDQDRRSLSALRSQWMRENSERQREIEREMNALRDAVDRPAPAREPRRLRSGVVDGVIAVGLIVLFGVLVMFGEL